MDQRDIDLLSSSRVRSFTKLLHRVSYQAGHNFPMSALIAKGNKVIVTGHNIIRTHPRSEASKKWCFGNHRPGIHAELSCFLSLERDYDLHNHDLYIYRRRPCGTPGLAKPCSYCYELILSSTLRRIIWTTGDDNNPFDMERLY